jgi:predicted RNase H-like HicB family nuclease
MYTAIIKKVGRAYIAWIEEVPGVNTQGKTLKEVKNNLAEALQLVLSERKRITRKEIGKGKIIREPLVLNA